MRDATSIWHLHSIPFRMKNQTRELYKDKPTTIITYLELQSNDKRRHLASDRETYRKLIHSVE